MCPCVLTILGNGPYSSARCDTGSRNTYKMPSQWAGCRQGVYLPSQLFLLPMSTNSTAPSTPCVQCAHADRSCRVRGRNVHCNRCLQKDLDCSFRRSKYLHVISVALRLMTLFLRCESPRRRPFPARIDQQHRGDSTRRFRFAPVYCSRTKGIVNTWQSYIEGYS